MANHKWEADPEAGDRWIDRRLATLTLDRDWNPDAGGALARLRERRHARGIAVRRWIWTSVAASVTTVVLMLIPASRACAEQPGKCVQRILHTQTAANTDRSSATAESASPVGVPLREPAAPQPAEVAPLSNATAPAASTSGFREFGSVAAPACLEVYIDFDCAHCGAFVRDVVPRLSEEYVATGKVKLLYRDFPLPNHPYAQLAARYADAAGALGYYGAAMEQLFKTRQVWEESGDVDSQIAQALPGAVMKRLRARVKSDPGLDAALLADAAAGRADHLDRTPFVVVVSGEKREAIVEAPLSFDVVREKLDALLKQ
jgi:protein-disulfide isomerase